MAVERWDARDEHVDETGEFVLYSDYAELLAHRNQLVESLYDIGAFANGEGDLGNIVARRCRVATRKAEAFNV